MTYRFSWKAFVLTAGAVLALGAGVFAAHRVQTPRNARALLARADKAEADGQPDRALRYLGRYLSLNPSDAAARFRYADTLERIAAGGRGRFQAIEVYQRVVADDPGNVEARRRLAVLLTDAGRWEDAIGHLKVLRPALPKDGTVAGLLGRCYGARGDWGRAAENYSAAAELPDAQPETYARLADCRRRVGNSDKAADDTIEDMVARFAVDHWAYLYRFEYRTRYQKHGAAGDLRAAQLIAPNAVEVLLADAADAARRGDSPAARSALESGRTKHPKDARFYLALSQLEVNAGNADKGIKVLSAGAKELPEDAAIIVELVHQFLDKGDAADARTKLKAVKGNPRIRWGTNDLPILEARLAIAAGEWDKAVPLLTAVRQRTHPESVQAAMIDRLLSRHAARTGQVNKQVELLRNSLAVAPNAAARLEYANALVEAGRAEEAMPEFQALADANPPSVSACLALVRWKAARTLDTVGPEGDWSEVEKLLARADTACKEAKLSNGLVAVTRAEILAARGRLDEARELLRIGCNIRPPEAAPWVALIGIEFRSGGLDKARDLLKKVPDALGNEVTVLLMSIVLAAQQPPEKANTAIEATEVVTKKLGALPADQAVRVWRLATALYLRFKRHDLALSAAQKVCDLRKDNLQSYLLRFEAAVRAGADKDTPPAIRAGADAETTEAIQKVREIEGPAGAIAPYCEALRLVLRSTQNPDKKELAAARGFLTEAGARRPGWPKVALLRAQLDALDDKPDQAAMSYREAFDLGERSLDVVGKLVEYYLSLGRHRDALDVITRLQEKGAAGLTEQQMFTAVYLQTADFESALKAAQRFIAQKAALTPNDHVWLSYVYSAAKQLRKAEDALVEACKQAETHGPWVAHVQFLVVNKRAADADALLSAIPGNGKLPPVEKELALAGCNEILGRPAEADRRYEAALTLDPTGWTTHRLAAEYYARTGRFDRAEPLLRTLVEKLSGGQPGEMQEMRRFLAVGLAESGDYQRCKTALKLLDANAAEGRDARIDAVARAVVLAKRPGSKREALALFQQLADRPLTPEARFVYAQVQLITGGVTRGHEQMLLTIRQSNENPVYVTHWIETLLAEKQLQDVPYWIGRLAKTGADRWPVVDLQARLLHADQRTEEAAARVAKYVPKTATETLEGALRLEEFKDAPGAERRFKELLARPDVPPTAALAYAAFLARRGRIDEALNACEGALDKLPAPVVVAGAMEILGYQPSNPKVYERVERWLGRVKDDNDVRAAKYMRAGVLDRQGRYADAIAAYRALATNDKDNAIAFYPLARLLLLTGGPAEAAETERLLAAAIEVFGPKDYLVELKAVVLLRQGRAAEAVKVLSDAIAEQPTPTALARLALAKWTAKDEPGARAAMNEANRRGFKIELLHPREVSEYQPLLALQPR